MCCNNAGSFANIAYAADRTGAEMDGAQDKHSSHTIRSPG